jgi:hypothetical protein
MKFSIFTVSRKKIKKIRLTTGNDFALSVGVLGITKVCFLLLMGVGKHIVDLTQHTSNIIRVVVLLGARGIERGGEAATRGAAIGARAALEWM